MGGARAAACGALCLLALLLAPAGAGAASPLKIREAYPGSVAAPDAEYVMLQMTAAAQNDIDGQQLRFYDANGEEAYSFTLPTDVPNGQSQRTVLLATAQASVIGAGSPDFTLPAGDRMGPAAGALCLTGSFLDDCLAWGNVAASALDFPDPQSANASPLGIVGGKALRRTIAQGCATWLDGPDDSGSSASDFSEVTPAPRSNTTTPSETLCPPDTTIQTAPVSPTNESAAVFTYAESPAEGGASFECALDWEGPLESSDFSACPGGGVEYTGLADGLHRFAVRASGAGGIDPTPKIYAWTIDTLAPETSIDAGPPEPSTGFSATFTYSSSEPQSSFRCQLDSGPVQVCPGSGKTYFDLADGNHSFRVWAVDNAANTDPSAAERSFGVQNVLRDLTPPDTVVLSGPVARSPSTAATFTYASSELGSSFQCRLSGRPFVPCAASGVSYANLKNGSYLFEVQAIDRAGNLDSLPATYSWTVAASLPKLTFRQAPPATSRLSKGSRALTLTIRLAADKPGASFRCRIDHKPFKPCKATVRIKAKPGRHRFEAYAVDALGNVGPEARRIFRVRGASGGGLFS